MPKSQREERSLDAKELLDIALSYMARREPFPDALCNYLTNAFRLILDGGDANEALHVSNRRGRERKMRLDFLAFALIANRRLGLDDGQFLKGNRRTLVAALQSAGVGIGERRIKDLIRDNGKQVLKFEAGCLHSLAEDYLKEREVRDPQTGRKLRDLISTSLRRHA